MISTTSPKLKVTAREFAEGRTHWHAYQDLNGYAFEPNSEGLKKLSAKLSIPVAALRRSINRFLEA